MPPWQEEDDLDDAPHVSHRRVSFASPGESEVHEIFMDFRIFLVDVAHGGAFGNRAEVRTNCPNLKGPALSLPLETSPSKRPPLSFPRETPPSKRPLLNVLL